VPPQVCRQLRQLEAHPRAPQMLAALLRKAGAGPELLPLLAEPARAALQGLSILARCKQPQYTIAFLQVGAWGPCQLLCQRGNGLYAGPLRRAVLECLAAAMRLRMQWQCMGQDLGGCLLPALWSLCMVPPGSLLRAGAGRACAWCC
jgi:hypothetical protein